MSQLGKLKQQRGRVKGHVTRMRNTITENPNMTKAEADVRLQKLNEYWHEFQEIETNIQNTEVSEEQMQELEAENEAQRVLFEEAYFATAAIVQGIINTENIRQEDRRFQTQQNIQNGQQGAINQNPMNGRVEAGPTRHNKPKLPDLRLPEFDGCWTKWLFFRNSFQAAIVGDPDLTELQKHQYLIGVLKGEALKVIEGFEINNENFTTVWQLLNDTYNNEMMIIESHLNQLFKFPDISQENKVDSMKALTWHIQTHLQSLKALNQPVDQWDSIIIHLAKKKLEYSEQKEWQEKIKDKTPQNMPRLTEFTKFITEKCHTLRMINQVSEQEGKLPYTPQAGRPIRQQNFRDKRPDQKVVLAGTAVPCKNCEGDHHISRCEEFLKLNIGERKKRLLERKLCFNCLKSGHVGHNCLLGGCKKCGQKHNTLLHIEQTSYNDNANVSCHIGDGIEEINDNPVVNYCTKKHTQVLLSTARIRIDDVNGEPISCRALLDPGSQVNLITAEMVKKLKLKCNEDVTTISGINQAQTKTAKTIQRRIHSRTEEWEANINCMVLTSITERLPQRRIDCSEIIKLEKVKLADPQYHEPDNIDVLIGAGLYWQLVTGKPLVVEGQPTWQNTKLGWILGGEIQCHQKATSRICCKVTNSDLNDQLEKFWLLEAVPEIIHYTKEEKKCEQHFEETFSRNPDGRFVVRLPVKQDVILGESRSQAKKRLLSIERRFEKNQELRQAYVDFMQDYLNQEHMSLVENTSILKQEESYFIPHQAVIKPDSITTKLRVVFDASTRTSNGTSLNDKLLQGPNLQGDLFKILVRFRTHQVVITGDVTQMYRQILIHPADRHYQLILWRNDPTQTEKTYQLNTVTYGTACAPFHALRCMKQLAREYQEQYPLATKVIEEDLYMDDALSGGETKEEVMKIQRELRELLMKGKFSMRKWRSNEREILPSLESLNKEEELMVLDREEAVKTLGLSWNSRHDCLQYHVTLTMTSTETKRTTLSKVSQIHDPLGLVTPVLINGKLFMQKLWTTDLEWDDPLPAALATEWHTYYSSLPKLNDLVIQRNINPGNEGGTFGIHGFADASEKAFGACLYCVYKTTNGKNQAHLICAKSKVAPLKSISLPGLELEAALLLSNLLKTVQTAFRDKISNITLWSDSTIVLNWISTEPHRLKTFVSNRVAKIQEATDGIQWNHVPSSENPADIISRGTTVESLSDNQLWWHGPWWLKFPSDYPATVVDICDLPELKNTPVVLVTTWASEILHKYSSFRKLCRIIAHCQRFIFNCRKMKKSGNLTLSEVEQAEITVLKMLQSQVFKKERECLENDRELPKKSNLKSLSIFIGADDLIRVGGRLTNALLTDMEKHPIVLPARNHVTRLILQEEHKRLRHCPLNQLLHSVRARYWPVQGRREVQNVVKRCMKCFRFKPRIPDILMGDLPEERVQEVSRPFMITGIDYAGPIQVRESRRRGRIHVSKGYVAVFVCMTTKAVHLELVSDLTTECFLAALNRFTGRRGLSPKIMSDQGTTFVGASNELQDVYKFISENQDIISEHLKKQHIEWSFIPPRAPHFGGLWEATVKIMKRHLLTVTGGKVHTFEEYVTLLVDIEAILNSRPLSPPSNDPNDLNVLTPAHFLVGSSLIQPLQHDWQDVPESRLSRWQQLQKLRQQLWVRWRREYLQELQKRSKWCSPGINIEPGTLVLMVDENAPPLQWTMARVVEIHPGKDGVVRVVTIRTSTGVLKRPVKKLCPLPSSD